MYRPKLPCVKTHVAEYSSHSLANSLPRPSNYSSAEWGDEKPVSDHDQTRFSITPTQRFPGLEKYQYEMPAGKPFTKLMRAFLFVLSCNELAASAHPKAQHVIRFNIRLSFSYTSSKVEKAFVNLLFPEVVPLPNAGGPKLS